jgi:hypothetical protein
MDNEKQDIEVVDKPKEEQRAFFIDVLTDMEGLKNFIYNGSDVAAYRNLQKIIDKIKDKIRKL